MDKHNRKKDELQEKFIPKRIRAMMVEHSFIRQQMLARAERLHNCSTWLKFQECPAGDYRKLVGANFCRDRLCPMCNWRRSRQLSMQIYRILHAAQERRKMKYIFLTLTVRNCKADELSDTLDAMFGGFKQMFREKNVNGAMVGWLRNLEVTYNAEDDTYHPHFHVLLGVKSDYFENYYISHATWTSLWQKSCKLEYTPIVNVKRVKPREAGQTYEAAAFEVAKYPLKDSEYIRETDEESDKVIGTLAECLHGRQLITFGKLFRLVRRDLKMQDVETDSADLVGADGRGCDCPVCASNLLETLYGWDFGGGVYKKRG